MKKEFNLVYVFISLIPVIVLFFLYSNLGAFANTSIFRNNGMIVSKTNFILVIIALSFVWYYLSFLFSKKISMVSAINQNLVRVLINLFLSVLSIWLIVSNL
ncbi:MAG TPA: hypothetical protein VN722_00320 [Hanamia sp.]|nr:hypothetical protein [Hanamia sp.]